MSDLFCNQKNNKNHIPAVLFITREHYVHREECLLLTTNQILHLIAGQANQDSYVSFALLFISFGGVRAVSPHSLPTLILCEEERGICPGREQTE